MYITVLKNGQVLLEFSVVFIGLGLESVTVGCGLGLMRMWLIIQEVSLTV